MDELNRLEQELESIDDQRGPAEAEAEDQIDSDEI